MVGRVSGQQCWEKFILSADGAGVTEIGTCE